MKLTKKEANKAHHVLLFGPPKSGKTQLTGELSEEFNLIYCDLENGTDTLLKFPEEWKERIEVVSLPDTRVFPIGIQTMLKLIRGSAYEVCETHGVIGCTACKKSGGEFVKVEFNALGPRDIVVVDSVTQLTNSAIAHITKDKDDLYKLQTDDWGNLGKLMDMFFSMVQQAPFNVICISHETEVEMEDGKLKLVPTAGTRNFSRNFAKYFDEVIYCSVVNGKHTAASSSTYRGTILTGSRTGKVLEKMDKPSLKGIFNGEIETINTATINSPADKALSALEKLKQQGVKK